MNIWTRISLWFERVYYCHHNALVIEDFEDRMSHICSMNTAGMSQPYYTKEAIQAEIDDYYDDRYKTQMQDELEPLADEMGLPRDTTSETLINAAIDELQALRRGEPLKAANDEK